MDNGGTANSGVDTFSRVFSLSVIPVNDAPIAVDDLVHLNQNELTNLDLTANDIDIDSAFDSHTFEFKNGPANGKLTLNANGTVEYLPNANYFGPDLFSYRVADTSGAFSLWADVALSINAIPIAVSDQAYVKSNSFTVVDLLSNDNDPDLR